MNVIRKVFCAATLWAIYVASFSAQPFPRQAESPAQQSADKAVARSQEKTQEQKGPEKSPAKPAEKLPAQIELLQTRVRFESNGDGRKEVHARVHINDELGARQFARLNFNYNRAFQSVEIPLAHITHANGGTSDVLPSAITDSPDPAVVNFPAYQDVRVKSIRILGLAPDDILEYRVITTTTHHPLAPDLWFKHTFDRSGVVAQESLTLDVPASRLKDSPSLRRMEMKFNSQTSPETRDLAEPNGSARRIYSWNFSALGSGSKQDPDSEPDEFRAADIEVSSYIVWGVLIERLNQILQSASQADATVTSKAAALTEGLTKPEDKLRALYDFVSGKISTIDVSLNATGFQTRLPGQVLSSGCATPLDKFLLFAALASSLRIQLEAALTTVASDLPSQLPSPALFTQILTTWGSNTWLDPSVEVAPFGLVTPALRGKKALWVRPLPQCGPTADCAAAPFLTVPTDLPVASFQKVRVDAAVAPEGQLAAKAQYTMRGDNELVLRVALHQTPKEKWKEVARLLALSDGFRGQIDSVSASDPYDTHEPIRIEYEITQPKFLDWRKKPLRIPAIIPLLGLPEPAAAPASGAKPSPIELGTPLDVEVSATVHLPEGTGAEVPAGTSIQRDFATYESHYAVSNGTLTASRHINFILKEIPADRAAEYNAFLHAVQNDESQLFTLERTSANDTQQPRRSP